MAIYEGRWDCEHCGHIGNMGSYKHCINCGSRRSENVRFYLPEDSEALSDEEGIKQALIGPDWICTFCSSPNLSTAKYCSECGSLQSGEFLEKKEYAESEVPRDSGKETQADYVEEYKEEHGLKKGVKRVFSWAKATAIAIFSGLVFWMSSFSSTVNVEIVSLPWERTMAIEEFREVQEEGWNLPSGAVELSSARAVHHYDKISRGYETKTRTVKVQVGTEQYVCGKRDLGNGFFEDTYCERPVYEERQEEYREEVFEEVPVYQTKYKYAIKRWKADETLKSSGSQPPASWPKSSKLDMRGQYRVSEQQDRYFIHVKRKGKIYKEETTETYWNKLNIGNDIPAEISTIFRYFKKLKDNPNRG